MNNISKIIISPLLAQKKLNNSGNGSSGINSQCISITNYTNKTPPNIFEKPTFPKVKEEDTLNDLGLPISEIISILSRKEKRVYERYLISERGKELLSKADEFEIPYDINHIDFFRFKG